jgi:hypothetical protein
MAIHTPVAQRSAPNGILKRLFWLLSCIFVGALTGFVGSTVSGNDIWYTAVPAAIALGWLFFADPTQCEPAVQRGVKAADAEHIGDDKSPVKDQV